MKASLEKIYLYFDRPFIFTLKGSDKKRYVGFCYDAKNDKSLYACRRLGFLDFLLLRFSLTKFIKKSKGWNNWFKLNCVDEKYFDIDFQDCISIWKENK